MALPSKEKKDATIDKATFIEHLNQKVGGNQRTMSTTEMYYDAFLETLKDELLNGDRVIFRGLGCFSLKLHRSHPSVVNPQASAEKINNMSDTTGAYLRLAFSPARASTLISSIRYNAELAQKVATYDKEHSDVKVKGAKNK